MSDLDLGVRLHWYSEDGTRCRITVEAEISNRFNGNRSKVFASVNPNIESPELALAEALRDAAQKLVYETSE